jgi:hypothetical protein
MRVFHQVRDETLPTFYTQNELRQKYKWAKLLNRLWKKLARLKAVLWRFTDQKVKNDLCEPKIASGFSHKKSLRGTEIFATLFYTKPTRTF